MSLAADTTARLPHVEGVLTFIAPMAEKPYNLAYDPAPGEARTNAVPDQREVPIYDMRPVADRFSLDREGIALVEARTAQQDFYDDAAVKRVYYPECIDLVLKATGGYRAQMFDHTIRRRMQGGVDRAPGVPRQPVTRVHNDYTLTSGPQRVRDLMGDEAEELLKHRFQIVNVWRPIRGPLRDAPLALADASTVPLDDFVASDLVYKDRTGETYNLRYNPAHRWFYAPEMRTDEAILIKSFDSADGVARFSPHTSFEDPTAPADIVPRESIEVRMLVFHKD